MGCIHPEVGAAVLHEHIEFFKAALIEKEREPLAGGKLSLAVLGIYALLTSSELGGSPALNQFLDFFLLNAHNIFAIINHAKIIKNL